MKDVMATKVAVGVIVAFALFTPVLSVGASVRNTLIDSVRKMFPK